MSKNEIISQEQIENKIFIIRDKQVMLDSDLAIMYQTETKYINRAVKRNIKRFPIDFAFQLNDKEWENLKFQYGTSSSHGGRRIPPYVFTEQGVAMLSAVLHTDIAIKVSVLIMQAFVQMRQLIGQKTIQDLRFSNIENKLIEHDQKFHRLFSALEKNELPQRGIFFNGQVFDAYELISKLIRSAEKSIVLIDNYIDESVLTHFSKKKKSVKVLLLTKKVTKQLGLDIKKANQQYGGFKAKSFEDSHDRFLIIDNEEIYHIGASLKDLGKKWFAFSKLEKHSVKSVLNAVVEADKKK